MKVLMVVGEFPPQWGGLADGTAHLVRELACLGVEVTVLTTKMNSQKDRTRCEGVEIRRVMSAWKLSEIGSVLEAVDEIGPGTIVHLMYGSPANRRRLLVNFLPLLLRWLRPNCRAVVTIHEFRTQRTRYRLWALPMLLAAHGLISVDPPDRKALLHWTKAKRPRIEWIPVAPNILPVPVTDASRRAWRLNLGIKDNTPIVTFFGSIWPQKGVLDLLQAINMLRNEGLSACLLLIGWFAGGDRGYESEVRKALAEGLSAGWIKLEERCPSKTVSEYLHASDVAVFPFHRGARSNNASLLAAIAHGLPAITTRGVDTMAGFAEQFGVLLVPARDQVALTKCLGQVLRLEDARRSLRVKALEAAKGFSWSSIASRTAEFYSLFNVPGK